MHRRIPPCFASVGTSTPFRLCTLVRYDRRHVPTGWRVLVRSWVLPLVGFVPVFAPPDRVWSRTTWTTTVFHSTCVSIIAMTHRLFVSPPSLRSTHVYSWDTPSPVFPPGKPASFSTSVCVRGFPSFSSRVSFGSSPRFVTVSMSPTCKAARGTGVFAITKWTQWRGLWLLLWTCFSSTPHSSHATAPHPAPCSHTQFPPVHPPCLSPASLSHGHEASHTHTHTSTGGPRHAQGNRREFLLSGREESDS